MDDFFAVSLIIFHIFFLLAVYFSIRHHHRHHRNRHCIPSTFPIPMNSNSPITNRPTIAVIGCGFAGQNFISHYSRSSLFHSYSLIVFESRNYFEFTPSILRSIVSPDHLKEILIPIEETKAGQFNLIQSTVMKLNFDSVNGKIFIECADQSNYTVDYCICSVGSSYGSKFKSDVATIDKSQRIREITQVHSSLSSASRVTIVGGGLVGVEFAAEICQFFPGLPVEIRTRDNTILNNLPKSAIQYASAWLTKHGATITCNSNVPLAELSRSATAGELIFDCTGNRPAQPLSIPGCELKAGFFNTNEFLQLRESSSNKIIPNCFVIGDCAAEPSHTVKTGYSADLTAEVAFNNLSLLIADSQSELRSFPRSLSSNSDLPVLLVCSLGSRDAILIFNSIVIPGRFASLVKLTIEITKIAACKGWRFAEWFWIFNEKTTLLAHRMMKRFQSKEK